MEWAFYHIKDISFRHVMVVLSRILIAEVLRSRLHVYSTGRSHNDNEKSREKSRYSDDPPFASPGDAGTHASLKRKSSECEPALWT
jgi:hypothetical protein